MTKIESFGPLFDNLLGDKLTAIVIRKVLLNITKDDLLLLFNSLYYYKGRQPRMSGGLFP